MEKTKCQIVVDKIEAEFGKTSVQELFQDVDDHLQHRTGNLKSNKDRLSLSVAIASNSDPRIDRQPS